MEPVLLFYGAMGLVTATVATTKLVRSHLLRSRRLDQIARELGLVRLGNHLMGERDGFKLGLQTHTGGKQKDGFLRLYTRFEPPLDLGLCIHQSNEKPPRFGQGKMQLPLGTSYAALADEAERVEALVTHEFYGTLLELRGPGNLIVSDAGATINAPLTATARDLVRQLEQLIWLSREVQSRRHHVPPAEALAPHVASWSLYAKQNGLTFYFMPLCMFGKIAGSTIYAYAVRTARKRYELEVYLRFDRPLDLGLLLQPMSTVDRMRGLFGSEDIRLGDPLFDDCFTVIASNPDNTRRLLDTDVQKRLLAMHQSLGPLTVTDDGVATRLENVPRVPTSVPQMVTQLLGLAKLIDDNRGDQRLGPYR